MSEAKQLHRPKAKGGAALRELLKSEGRAYDAASGKPVCLRAVDVDRVAQASDMQCEAMKTAYSPEFLASFTEDRMVTRLDRLDSSRRATVFGSPSAYRKYLKRARILIWSASYQCPTLKYPIRCFSLKGRKGDSSKNHQLPTCQ